MKKVFYFMLIVLALSVFVSATDIHFFYSTGCPHCHNVNESGVLQKVVREYGSNLFEYNLYDSQENRDLFAYYCNDANISQNVPLVVIDCGGDYNYLVGDRLIIENLENYAKVCEGEILENGSDYSEDKVSFFGKIYSYLENKFKENFNSDTGKLSLSGWFILCLVAFIDSVNPCAFGVLIFLMASLLKMGSAKRALKSGLIYSFVVFVVYFFIGWGLYRIIDLFSYSSYFSYFYLAVAGIILVLGFLQIKDFFWYGKGPTLKISSKSKPIIEKFMKKGTLVSIIVLGVIVSLFELPCTGEVYLGILSAMHLHKVFGLGYLLIYNLIFVFPLVVLTFLVYKGTSTQKLQKWTTKNRKYMKLFSGLLLLGLAAYIFIRSIGFV